MKPYDKRQKNDAADADAICKAVSRPNMRFIETKTPEHNAHHLRGNRWRSRTG